MMERAEPTPMLLVLPGPDRKKSPKIYHYRVLYKAPSDEPGCLITWAVEGGREEYQVALERISPCETRWHCTCADATYRSADCPVHQCKHIRGIIDHLPVAV